MKLEDFNIEDIKNFSNELKGKMPEFNDIFKNLNDFKSTIDKMNSVKKTKLVVINGITCVVSLLSDNSVKLTLNSEEEAEKYYKEVKGTKRKTFLSWLKF